MSYGNEAIIRVLARIDALRARDNEDTDALTKSLRKYSTTALPILLERLASVNKISFCPAGTLKKTNTYEFVDPGQGMRANKLMNFAFQSFFDHEETSDFHEVIYPRLSTKTFRVKDGDSVRQEVAMLIDGTRSDLGGLPSFRDIMLKLDPELSDLFSADINESSLGRGINRFMLTNNGEFPADSYVQIDGRIIRHDLTMKVKYYPNRDDNRAYCQDTNLARCLSGACLQRLILPPQMRVKAKLEWCQVVPAREKDMLDLEVPLAPKDFTDILILGDISNFTGSAANSWLLLYNMASELSIGSLKGKKPNMYCVDDQFFEATWEDLLRVYLFYTVGYPCTREDNGEFAFLPGGFLGVNANIITGLLMLSLVLTDLRLVREEHIRKIFVQAGGDDFAIYMHVKRGFEAESTKLVRDTLSKYVGHLKELIVLCPTEQPDGVLTGYEFCRKRIIKRKTRKGLLLISEEAVPLVAALFDKRIPRSALKQTESWREFDQACLKYERKVPDRVNLTGTLRLLFEHRFQKADTRRPIKAFNLDGAWDIRAVDKSLHTVKALEAVQGILPVFGSLGVYLDTLETASRHALIMEKVEIRKCEYQNASRTVVVSSAETKRVRRNTKTEFEVIGYIADQTFWNELKFRFSI